MKWSKRAKVIQYSGGFYTIYGYRRRDKAERKSALPYGGRSEGEYQDAVDNRAEQIESLKADLESGNVDGLTDYLKEIIEEGEYMVPEATALLGRIEAIVPQKEEVKESKVSFYAAEDMEFHQGRFRENLTVEKAIEAYLDRDTPDYVPTNNNGARFRVSFGNESDADAVQDGLDKYDEAYEPKYENIGFYKKLVDSNGSFAAGVIADVNKDAYGFVDALFVEEPLRHQGLGSFFLKETEEFAKENGAPVIMTSAGDWNVDFFKKNGYLLRGELKDVPKGHNCYELYKNI